MALPPLNRIRLITSWRRNRLFVSLFLLSDIKDKIDYEEAKVESIFLGKF